MANIVTDAEMAAQHGFRAVAVHANPGREQVERFRLEQHCFEECDAFIHGLEEAARLGLQRERDALSGPALRQYKVGDRLDHPGRHCRGGANLSAARLERSRHGGNAAIDAVGKNGGENGCAVGRKRNTLRAAPVRKIDLLFHAHAVKWTEREGVDGEDVGAERRKLVAESRERIRLTRARGRFTRQP